MSNIRVEIDGDGIALITWDMPGRTMNVLSPDSLREYNEAVDRVIADPAIKGAVVTSAKPAFIAGADLDWLESLGSGAASGTKQEKARALFEDMMGSQRLFRKVETAKKPFAAAINGTAMGGGLEVCLACHHRVAADDPKTQLGLPESKVGLLPGAGGTQRLTRMLGIAAALPLLLEGRALSPAQALKLRMIDAVVPAADLVAAAKKWVLQATQDQIVKPWDKPGFAVPGGDFRSAAGMQTFTAANALQRKKTYGNYPALDAIQCAVYDGILVPIDTALKIEVRYFVTLLLDPTARNMIRTHFINLQKANKLSRRPAGVAKRAFTKIGVLGGGMMGAGIAHVAAQAGLEVVLIDVDQAAADRGRDHVKTQQEKAVAAGRSDKGKAEAIVGRIHPTTDYEQLRGADLVIEAVFEDRTIKADVTRRAEAMLGVDGVFASNTSTLPITGLAEASVRPERFIGLHFFSPVERMPLVEIIRGKRTGDEALAIAMDFVQRIRKTPIVVNDSRGFYTSRVFGTYTGEGMLMLAEGLLPALIENGGKATSMPVAPLALCDEVALDLIHRIRMQTKKDLGASYRETPADKLVAEMVERHGRLGKKVGKGFYDYPKDGPKRLWPGLAKLAPPAATQPDVSEVKTRLLAIQALETARCMAEGVVTDPADADIGATLGWGFAPWTGGPLSYIDRMGAAAFVELCDRLAQRHGERFLPHDELRKMARDGATFYGAAARKAA